MGVVDVYTVKGGVLHFVLSQFSLSFSAVVLGFELTPVATIDLYILEIELLKWLLEISQKDFISALFSRSKTFV